MQGDTDLHQNKIVVGWEIDILIRFLKDPLYPYTRPLCICDGSEFQSLSFRGHSLQNIQ